MTRLWLVRHGPTHARAMVGWTDLPADLSDTAALARLRAALPDAPAVSSDLSRAIATADALKRPRLPDDPALREISFGAWEMRSFAEVEAEDPDRLRAYWDDPGDTAPPGGESWNALSARVDAAIDRLTGLGLPDLIVVAHFGPILRVLQRAHGQSARTAFAQKIDNLSLTEVSRSEVSHGADGWRVERVNHRA